MSTEAQKRASKNNYAKKLKNCVAARYFAPIIQHEALKKLANKTGKTLEELTNEFIATGLKTVGQSEREKLFEQIQIATPVPLAPHFKRIVAEWEKR